MTKSQQSVMNRLKVNLEVFGLTRLNIGASYLKTAQQLEEMGKIWIHGRFPTKKDLQVELLEIES